MSEEIFWQDRNIDDRLEKVVDELTDIKHLLDRTLVDFDIPEYANAATYLHVSISQLKIALKFIKRFADEEA